MELDYLEKNLILTLAHCSVYTPSQIKQVYAKTKSWDQTIAVLKSAVQEGIRLGDAIRNFNHVAAIDKIRELKLIAKQ